MTCDLADLDSVRHAVSELQARYDAIDVPAGRDVVRFRYAPYSHYPLLIAIGAVTLLGLALYPRRSGVARRSSAGTVARRAGGGGGANDAASSAAPVAPVADDLPG